MSTSFVWLLIHETPEYSVTLRGWLEKEPNKLWKGRKLSIGENTDDVKYVQCTLYHAVASAENVLVISIITPTPQ